MSRSRFPDPRRIPTDIVALGAAPDPATLIDAYRHGIFPWPIEGLPLPWFCPRRRAILRFDEMHISRSLARERRRSSLQFTIDQAFRKVIELCSAVPRPEQDGTWITDEIVGAYVKLHELGHAHSVEAWDGPDLVGGLYGVDAGGAFGGESMFYARPNASKLALLHMVDHLRSRGLDWMDIQVMTPHMAVLGAKLVPKSVFLRMLEEAQEKGRQLFG